MREIFIWLFQRDILHLHQVSLIEGLVSLFEGETSLIEGNLSLIEGYLSPIEGYFTLIHLLKDILRCFTVIYENLVG